MVSQGVESKEQKKLYSYAAKSDFTDDILANHLEAAGCLRTRYIVSTKNEKEMV